MELYSCIWSIVESVIFLFVVFIFFKDPIRRWNFFGYRPTAVMGIFDPHQEKVLLSKINGAWSFNQGGMYEENIYFTAKEILRRELGLSETRFKLVYTKPLGAFRIENKQLLTRARMSTISIFKNLRGKGYMACFVRTDLRDIEAEIKKGAGVQDVKIVSYDEAMTLVKDSFSEEHRHGKKLAILSMIEEIKKFASGVKAWEETIREKA